jgi:hypothetical protein
MNSSRKSKIRRTIDKTKMARPFKKMNERDITEINNGGTSLDHMPVDILFSISEYLDVDKFHALCIRLKIFKEACICVDMMKKRFQEYHNEMELKKKGYELFYILLTTCINTACTLEISREFMVPLEEYITGIRLDKIEDVKKPICMTYRTNLYIEPRRSGQTNMLHINQSCYSANTSMLIQHLAIHPYHKSEKHSFFELEWKKNDSTLRLLPRISQYYTDYDIEVQSIVERIISKDFTIALLTTPIVSFKDNDNYPTCMSIDKRSKDDKKIELEDYFSVEPFGTPKSEWKNSKPLFMYRKDEFLDLKLQDIMNIPKINVYTKK